MIGVRVAAVRAIDRASREGTSELVETWERLQARLFHLGYLGEELPRVVSEPGVSVWLYRVIAAEAGEVARLAGDYIAECERPGSARHGGGAL